MQINAECKLPNPILDMRMEFLYLHECVKNDTSYEATANNLDNNQP